MAARGFGQEANKATDPRPRRLLGWGPNFAPLATEAMYRPSPGGDENFPRAATEAGRTIGWWAAPSSARVLYI
jgi:hypothetical protein